MLPDLSGDWEIKRRIIGLNARFRGGLTFMPDGKKMHYVEKGQMRLPSGTTDAYQSYIYKPEGQTLTVLYGDGRPFLQLRFEDGVAKDTHVCGGDTYQAIFKVKDDNTWLCAFAVTGPRKNYFTVSKMTRQI